VLFVPVQQSVQITHCLILKKPFHPVCLIDCITVAFEGGKGHSNQYRKLLKCGLVIYPLK